MVKNTPISITWLGHSAFLIGGKDNKTVLIDPWLENPKSPVPPAEVPRPDIILITHGHSDHLGNGVEIAKKYDVPVVAIFEVFLHLQKHGIQQAIGMNKGGTIEVDGVCITMTHAIHSSDIDVAADGIVLPGGEAAGFVVRIPGFPAVYHAGDTDVFSDMRLIQDLHHPDIAILPIGGLYTMGPREAAMAVGFLKPRWVIGMHYGTFPVLTGTPEELRKHLPPGMKSCVVDLTPGKPRSFA